MSTTRQIRYRFFAIGFVLIAAMFLIGMQRPARAAEFPEEAEHTNIEEEIPTVDSMVIRKTDVMDIPAANGEVVGQLMSGEEVEVYRDHVNEEWNAIVEQDGTIRYIPLEAVALTALPYEYQYGSELTNLTGYAGEQLESLLAGTGLEGLGETFAQQEKIHGINALFLISITKLESGNGSSNLARAQNNLGGLKNGNSGYLSFDSKADCVEYMARLLSENYLQEGGRFYSGATVAGVSKRYCEQSAYWTQSVESLMQECYLKMAQE